MPAPTRVELPDTATALLDVAERLMASDGVDAVSLRAITAAAEANVASIHYHFGSREGLMEALVARRMDMLGEQRAALLAASGEPPSVEVVARALVLPLVEFVRADGGHDYLRVLAQLLTGTLAQREIAGRRFQWQHELLVAAVLAARPALGEATVRFRLKLCGQVIVDALSAPPPRTPDPTPIDLGDELVAFVTAALGGHP